MTMTQRVVLVLSTVLLVPVSLPAQNGQRLPVDPAVTVGTLPNGIRYYVRENRRPEKRAELRLVVNAGSILEDDAQQGLAHFVEHMAFNGTKNFEKQEIVRYLEGIGMRFGPDLNAYTSFDETVYMLQVPTDSLSKLVTGIRILEEWAHNIAFDTGEVDKERGVVTEEWRLGQGADERLRKQYFPILFKDSRYAERLPIGKPEILQSAKLDELVRFYREWYRPDLMAVVAVGDFEKGAVEKLIQEHFGRIPAASGGRPRTLYDVPDHAETLVAIATDPEETNTQVQVNWKRPMEPDGTLEAYRAQLVRSLYGRMLNARFSEITQKADPPFIGAGSGYGELVRTRAAYTMGAGVQNGGVERGLEALLTEGERVARHGFSATELERHKTNLLRGFERAFAERDKTESGSLAFEYVGAFLNDEPIPGIAYEYELVKRLVPGITVDEVNALARAWMTDRSRAVIVTAPEQAGTQLPTRDQLLAVFDRVAKKPIEPYVDAVTDAPLVATPPTPGSIVATRELPALGTTLLELSNGVKVYLKPTTFKDDQVVLGAYSPGGLSRVPDEQYLSGSFASTLVSVSGLGSMDAIQLQKALTGKVASVNAGPGEFAESLSGTSSTRDIETMLQLVYLKFTAPRNDSVAYESFMQRIRASLANRDASPDAAFSDTLQLTLWQNHPRAQPQTVQALSMIDRATAFRIYQDRFADASDFTFVIVGAFDPQQIRPLIERYLGSLPAVQRDDAPRDNGMRPVRGVVEKVVRRGVEPKSKTQIMFTGPFEQTRENRLTIAMLVDVLRINLRDVLREDMGGTYGVSIGQSNARLPEPRYNVNIGFGSAPERLEELTQAVFQQIEQLKANGPDAETLAKVQEQQRRGYETSLQQNPYWVSVLLREAETGEPATGVLDFVQRVNAVTAEQIRDAARAWLDMKNYVRVSLVPQVTGS